MSSYEDAKLLILLGVNGVLRCGLAQEVHF